MNVLIDDQIDPAFVNCPEDVTVNNDVKRGAVVDSDYSTRYRVLRDRCHCAIVEGLNIVTKHKKPDNKNPQGSIVEIEAGIHISSLMLIEPKTGKGTRVGRTKTDEGWVRVSKKPEEKTEHI